MTKSPTWVLVAALAALAAVSGCTTPDAAASKADGGSVVAESGLPPPGLAFSYRFEGPPGAPTLGPCQVHFERDGLPPVRVSAQLRADADRVLAKVPLGAYRLAAVTCADGRRFAAPPALVVQVRDHGEVLFIGRLVLDFRPSGLGTIGVFPSADPVNRNVVADLERRGYRVTWPTGKS